MAQPETCPVRRPVTWGATAGVTYAVALRVVLATVAVTIALLGSLAAPAAAHTDLDSTSPVDGSTVEGPVRDVSLTFTLPVTQLGDGVSITGPDGPVPVEVTSEQGGLIWTAVPDAPLPDGSYAGEWTVAAQDGHPLSGAFTFTVQGASSAPGAQNSTDQGAGPTAATDDATATTAPEQHSDTDAAAMAMDSDDGADSTGWAEVLARFGSAAALWGALVAGGALIFAKTVLLGSDRSDTPLVARAIRWSAAVILIGLVVRVMARAVLISQGDVSAAISPSAIADSLGESTRVGLGLQALGAVIVLCGTRSMLTLPWISGAGLALVGAGHVVAGHSNTIEPRWIVVLADVAHLVAAAVWVGGVVMIGMVLRHRRRSGRPLNAKTIGTRFSVVAAGAVAGVGVAGVVLTITILDRPQQLWESSWGLLLLAKVGVVAVVAAIGAYNHFKVVPALSVAPSHPGSAGGASELLRRSASYETAIMVVIVVLTAWLVAAAVTP